MRPRSRFARRLAVAMTVAVGGGLAVAAETTALAGRTMGTTWAVKYVVDEKTIDTDALGRRVAARLEQLEQIFSTYRSNSELSRFNRDVLATDWVPVSRELAQVAADSRQISAATEGAFDPTVAPLLSLWGFGPAGPPANAPSAAQILAARARVDWRALEARPAPPSLRRARSGITADFSSMAKGFAADAITDLLLGDGVRDLFVQVGGDTKAGGRSVAAAGWRVGVQTPIEDGEKIARVVVLRDEALSTSGNHRNFVTLGGRRHGHIIDPRSGAPVEGDLIAVSVVHASCAFSSGWATALFVLGPDAGMTVARREGLAAIFFVRDAHGKLAQQSTLAFAQRAPQ